MSKRVKKYLPLLTFLCKAKPNLIKAIIKEAPSELINVISECALNILKGNVKLKSSQLKKLCRHKHCLRILAKKRTSVKKRKKYLQSGGFIGALLPALLGPVVGSIIRNVI